MRRTFGGLLVAGMVMNSAAEAAQGIEEKKKMAVYTIYADRSADEASGNYGFENEAIEGDWSTIFPIGDYEFHPVMNAVRLEDGLWLEKSAAYQGVPVHMEGMPKRVRWGG